MSVPGIRTAVVEDAEVIAAIHVEGWQSSYGDLLPPSYLSELNAQNRTHVWRENLSDPAHRGWTFLAETTERGAVGFIATLPSRDGDAPPNTGEIAAIYLRHGAKGRGFGAALMRAGLHHLEARNCTRVTLLVLEGNNAARAFYERFGFELDGTRVLDRIGGHDVVELRYALSQTG